MKLLHFKTAVLALTGAMTLIALPASVWAGERVAYPSSAVEGLPYSGAVRAGNMVYVGGVLGTIDGGQQLAPGGIQDETRQALAHIGTMLEDAGSGLEHAVKCTVLLAAIDDFPAMNEVFRETFPVDPPTRSTIIVPAIPMDAAIEVECNAVVAQ